jgi:CubicO group peptidase (beta-lactamase class C family)
MKSGLAREPANSSTHSRGSVSDWETLLIAALPDTRFELAPGSRYLYSNIGYAVLGAALARAAGMPYTQYVQQRILTPLNMQHTAFEPTDSMRPRIAKGYELSDTGRVSSELPSRQQDGRGFRIPNGGLYSTVGDVARFVAFELGNGPEAVLDPQVLRQTFERLSWNSAREESGYGIGMQIRRSGNLVAFGHDGIVPGYVANVRFDCASKTGVIVLRNVHGGRFELRGLTYAALAEIAKQ